MKMVRIHNSNGSQCVLTWHEHRDGLHVSSNFYDATGYYVAHKSNNIIMPMDTLQKQIDAALDLGLTVEIF